MAGTSGVLDCRTAQARPDDLASPQLGAPNRNQEGDLTMLSLRTVFVLGTALVALTGCATPGPTPADEAAVRAVNPAWFAAHSAGDADGVAALYAEDAVLSIPGMPPLRGRAAIKDALVKDIASMREAGLTNKAGDAPEFGIVADMAWEWSTFSVLDKSGATVDTGKYVTVHAKKDGKWLIVRDIWNMDSSAPQTQSVVVAARVNDGVRWEEAFRTHAELFKTYTAQSPVRFSVNEANDVAVLFHVTDLEKFQAAIASQATADAMTMDGVKRETVKQYVFDKEVVLP
jgi:uncharacterized protein (TIGR02246 family)